MKTFLLNKTGRLHDTHTEDYVFVKEMEPDWVIAAVMDGCSSGKESFFASALLGKLLHKACRVLPQLIRINPDFNLKKVEGDFLGNFLLNQVFDGLDKARKILDTELIEILSTLILLVYNISGRSAWINISGDGMIVHNGEILEVDQNNVPDYMAYHLDIPFDTWMARYSKTYTFHDAEDISISTDGITKFYSLHDRRSKTIDPVEYLLADKSLTGSPDMLEEKFRILSRDYGLSPYDDLGMIRIIHPVK